MHIPQDELVITFVRSSGKGGQNVNKLATKAVVRWNVYASRVLTPEQKQRLAHRLQNKITSGGDIVITAESERSQDQNRAQAIHKLQELIKRSLHVPKARKKTKPTKASRERRLKSKQKLSQKKAVRRGIWD